MTQPQLILVLATLSSAIGLALVLPRGRSRGKSLGVLLGLAGLVLFGTQLPRLADRIGDGVFLALAVTTVISAVGSISLRSPVYCAIWFAMTLLGTAGLFLYQGAQFLGVATIVVYAGAILVTFLFVLMLAQPEGHAFYDRVTWESFLSAGAGALLVGILTATTLGAVSPRTARLGPPDAAATTTPLGSALAVLEPNGPKADRAHNILADQHMAHLGAELFSRQLLAIEVAGTLLLVALAGAVAIVAQSQPSGKLEARRVP